jgi:hypothetical protein
MAGLGGLFDPAEGRTVVLHHPLPLQQREAVLILRLGQSLPGREPKPPGGLLVVLDDAVTLGVAHAKLQLRFGVAQFGADVRQAGGFACGRGGQGCVLSQRKPGRRADDGADGGQQQQGFERAEHPQAMAALATAQRPVQQQMAQAVVRVQRAAADLVAPALWAGERHALVQRARRGR